jgi:hypothetical protein
MARAAIEAIIAAPLAEGHGCPLGEIGSPTEKPRSRSIVKKIPLGFGGVDELSIRAAG